MQNNRIRYIFTWIALGVILVSGIMLLVISWNSKISGSPQGTLLVFLWIFLSASGIFLFMIAVKKAHRQLIEDQRKEQAEASRLSDRKADKKGSQKDLQVLDFAATARKLVRRSPEASSVEDLGKVLLKNLARDLEIMSGIFYLKKKEEFIVGSSYALATHNEPYSFKEGEGLTGQVARNQQLMLLTSLPEGYLEVFSGLGKAKPTYLAIVPLIHNNRTIAVIECSGYKYDPHDIENMFRILARDLMEKISPNL